MTAGDRLRELRQARGLPQVAVAIRARCSPNTVLGVEKWGLVPSPAIRSRIAAALDVPPSAIWNPDATGSEEERCRAQG